MFPQFAFVNQMSDQIATAHFAAKEAQRQAEIKKAEEKAKVAALKRQQDVDKAKADARADLVRTTNEAAVKALETGDLQAIKDVYELLQESERTSFLHAQPLESALLNEQFIVAEYLFDKGMRCDNWQDYVIDTESELYKMFATVNQASSKFTPAI